MDRFKNVSDEELHLSAIASAKKEQLSTLDVLEHLYEVERRGLYLKKTQSSVFEYAVKLCAIAECKPLNG